MNLTTKKNSRAYRRRMKKDGLAQVEETVIAQPSETEEQILYRRVAEQIVNICINNDVVIFGGYVREYICGRNFDKRSDIDLFSKTQTVEDFREILNSSGFKCSPARSTPEKYHGVNDDFKVYHFRTRMVNDFFFTGKNYEIEIDFVESECHHEPPFDALDFSCNAWIWDIHGIRLSRSTGVDDIDRLSPRDIKEKEMQILAEAKKLNTAYYFMDQEGYLLNMDDSTIYRRQIRLGRINKMLERGWTITNLPHLIYGTATSSERDFCVICMDEIKDCCAQLSCCRTKYHRGCFIDYGKDQLKERTYVRCAQRCSELHL